jgi:hypothetical protein
MDSYQVIREPGSCSHQCIDVVPKWTLFSNLLGQQGQLDTQLNTVCMCALSATDRDRQTVCLCRTA